MKSIIEGKLHDGVISSNDIITEKEGYEAMLYMLKYYWELTGSNDLTDILSGGEYWLQENAPADTAFWRYWLEAIEKVKRDGPPPLKENVLLPSLTDTTNNAPKRMKITVKLLIFLIVLVGVLLVAFFL